MSTTGEFCCPPTGRISCPPTWLVANADPLGVTYIIWDGRIWTGSSWRAYTGGGIYNPNHPTGGHHDHIHVSVRRG